MREGMKPWLVQRATFKDRTHREGVDSMLEFDYMGSAEYEFGAIGKSLKRIRENLRSYELHAVCDPSPIPKSAQAAGIDERPLVKNVFGKKLMLWCRTDAYDSIVPHIMELKANRLRLKEPSYFEAQFDPRSCPPGLAEIKRKMEFIRRVSGDRLFRAPDGTVYTVEKGTGRVRGPNEYRLGVNCWWDLDHDWIMFFDETGRANKLLAAIRNVPAQKEQPTTV